MLDLNITQSGVEKSCIFDYVNTIFILGFDVSILSTNIMLTWHNV